MATSVSEVKLKSPKSAIVADAVSSLGSATEIVTCDTTEIVTEQDGYVRFGSEIEVSESAELSESEIEGSQLLGLRNGDHNGARWLRPFRK